MAFLLVLAGSAQAAELAVDCQRPTRPVIPDGEGATEPELLSTRTALEQYLTDGDGYLKCLRAFEEGLGEELRRSTGTNCWSGITPWSMKCTSPVMNLTSR